MHPTIKIVRMELNEDFTVPKGYTFGELRQALENQETVFYAVLIKGTLMASAVRPPMNL